MVMFDIWFGYLRCHLNWICRLCQAEHEQNLYENVTSYHTVKNTFQPYLKNQFVLDSSQNEIQ